MDVCVAGLMDAHNIQSVYHALLDTSMFDVEKVVAVYN
jgi:hypothetical protein